MYDVWNIPCYDVTISCAQLTMNVATVLTLTCNWCQLRGLRPSTSNILTTARLSSWTVQVPYLCHNHNIIAMSCDIVEPQYCSMHSEKISSSELRGIIPTPGLPGNLCGIVLCLQCWWWEWNFDWTHGHHFCGIHRWTRVMIMTWCLIITKGSLRAEYLFYVYNMLQ